jgi:hypothetical protein
MIKQEDKDILYYLNQQEKGFESAMAGFRDFYFVCTSLECEYIFHITASRWFLGSFLTLNLHASSAVGWFHKQSRLRELLRHSKLA